MATRGLHVTGLRRARRNSARHDRVLSCLAELRRARQGSSAYGRVPPDAAGGAGRPKPRYGRLRTKAGPSGRRQGGVLHVIGALFWTFCDTRAL